MASVEDIEGVGPAYAAKLAEAGVKTIEGLLEAGATRKGRADLIEKTGISDKLVLKWVNHADLIRVQGVDPNLAELLEAAGVDTVKELATRNATNLAAKLAEVNGTRKLASSVPDADGVTAMIAAAKGLPGVLTY